MGLSASKKMKRPRQGKTRQNEMKKRHFVTRAMASVQVSSGTQSTALRPGARITRLRRVLWTKNSVGPRHTHHPVNHQGHRHVHLPKNKEEPMEVDPPRDEEEPMEVDQPLTGQAWSYLGMSLLSSRRQQKVCCRSARPATNTLPSQACFLSTSTGGAGLTMPSHVWRRLVCSLCSGCWSMLLLQGYKALTKTLPSSAGTGPGDKCLTKGLRVVERFLAGRSLSSLSLFFFSSSFCISLTIFCRQMAFSIFL